MVSRSAQNPTSYAQGLPDGNPEAVHTVPLVQTKDPVLRAHGEATGQWLDDQKISKRWPKESKINQWINPSYPWMYEL